MGSFKGQIQLKRRIIKFYNRQIRILEIFTYPLIPNMCIYKLHAHKNLK